MADYDYKCSVCGRTFAAELLAVTVTIESWDVGPLGVARVEHERAGLRACGLGDCGARLWDELASLERRLAADRPMAQNT